jgi:hypothetical protein
MGKRNNDSLGNINPLWGMIGTMALTAVVAVILVILRLERTEVFVLALILVGAVALALVIGAVALVIRARRGDNPVVEKHYHTKERVVDGRHPPRTHVVALPGGRPDPMTALYPHLLRGAYQAGRSETGAGYGEPWEEPTEWEGNIIEVEPINRDE